MRQNHVLLLLNSVGRWVASSLSQLWDIQHILVVPLITTLVRAHKRGDKDNLDVDAIKR